MILRVLAVAALILVAVIAWRTLNSRHDDDRTCFAGRCVQVTPSTKGRAR